MNPRADEPLIPCPSCGQFFRAAERKCPHCGAANPGGRGGSGPMVPPPHLQMQVMYGPPPSPPPRPGRAWLYVGAAVLIAAAAGAVYFLAGR